MSKRVLIAEDDPSSLTILQLMLESDGEFEVVTAADGEEAWTHLTGGGVFDVCIFDIMMPRLDGLALTQRLRDHPALHDQPVMLCTALNDRGHVDQAAALGVANYIVKPFARDHVVKQVNRVCDERQAAAKLESPARTASRLGIPERQVTAFLTKVARDSAALVQELRAGPPAPGNSQPLIRINALKGAAVNLGAFGLFRAFAGLETTWNAGAPAKLEAPLLEIERECERLNSALTPPVPAAAN